MTAQSKVEATSLAAAMAAAFAEIESATKAANNPHFKSKYADLTAIIEAIKPPLIRHGLYFTQNCHPSEDGVMVETILNHSGGEKESLGKLFVPANKRDAQGFGSALTYARRYALQTAFGVPTEDDDGNAAAKATSNAQQRPAQPKADLPFPPGPAKNRTDLKTRLRDVWRDVEGSGDDDTLDIVLSDNKQLLEQGRKCVAEWFSGFERDGTSYEGFDQLVDRRRTDIANDAWKNNPVSAG